MLRCTAHPRTTVHPRTTPHPSSAPASASASGRTGDSALASDYEHHCHGRGDRRRAVHHIPPATATTGLAIMNTNKMHRALLAAAALIALSTSAHAGDRSCLG